MLARLILVLMMGGVAVVHAQDPQAGPLSCKLTAEGADGKVLFQGLVATEVEAAGQYRFEITRRGPAGSVTSRQGGSFVAKPPLANILGQMAISLEAGADYKAILVIEAGGRTYECEKTGSGSTG
ncbi:curli-like amyloid fiber formation chaperone CsgH [Microvirga subterranea]|uniref:CsgH-like domain-containing protein n=1 Tax=Microvirga subterranea TaxID=186651 RepID=A0A370H8I1_9HYPH|nr:curli-like amyloid fiber formation chaperone CsgH [Microvirga subterranea]RDI52550.1 hypothetical protein DES45_11411 [Microvirga subterranea]